MAVNRSLLAPLVATSTTASASSASTVDEDRKGPAEDEDAEVPAEVEDIIGVLLDGLRDKVCCCGCLHLLLFSNE